LPVRRIFSKINVQIGNMLRRSLKGGCTYHALQRKNG
jgi:hypothetical protein